ncbi:hypothetical protein C0J52_10960 [Blattella germanica]|nr:hypothetical protein C0J52_10960 [Blattella germanica]
MGTKCLATTSWLNQMAPHAPSTTLPTSILDSTLTWRNPDTAAMLLIPMSHTIWDMVVMPHSLEDIKYFVLFWEVFVEADLFNLVFIGI